MRGRAGLHNDFPSPTKEREQILVLAADYRPLKTTFRSKMDNELPSVEASAMHVRHSSSSNTNSSSSGSSPVRGGTGRSSSGDHDDVTEVCETDDAEDFAVLPAEENKAALTATTNSNGDTPVVDDDNDDAGTSFTADSPYFDAFCQSELSSLDTLSTTLGEISIRAKIFAQTGTMMSQATLRLANACKLKHGGDDEDLEPSERGGLVAVDPALYTRRKKAIGDEMAGALELLGEVSCCCFSRGGEEISVERDSTVYMICVF
jgi:hypothetical protein